MELLDLNQSRSIDMNEYKNIDRCSKIVEPYQKILEQHLKTTAVIHERVRVMYDSNTDGVLDKAELNKYLVSLNLGRPYDVSFNKSVWLGVILE